MLSKDEYRDLFLRSMPYVKYSNICKECGVNFNGFSAYMRGKNEYAISAEKLELLRKASLEKINELLSIDESK